MSLSPVAVAAKRHIQVCSAPTIRTLFAALTPIYADACIWEAIDDLRAEQLITYEPTRGVLALTPAQAMLAAKIPGWGL
jgi:hypothetical protein